MVGGSVEELEETGSIIINLRLDRKHEPLCSVPLPGLQMAQVPDAVWALGEREQQTIICQKCKERAPNALVFYLSPLFSQFMLERAACQQCYRG